MHEAAPHYFYRQFSSFGLIMHMNDCWKLAIMAATGCLLWSNTVLLK
jgi:hypothetical protein